MKENPWILHHPTQKQTEFLLHFEREVFYGGAAAGGKSDALLMGALMFAEHPGYQALILRRTYPELSMEGSLMDRSHHWLGGTSAHWNAEPKRWEFPSGASLTFGYLQNENDKYRYKSSQFDYIGFDELTGFTLSQYRYLFSRLRRLRTSPIPSRMRSASNPGDIGHTWVKQRFIVEGDIKGRPFIPARLEDNPYLDTEEYELSLAELDPVTRSQLRKGDWDALPGGRKFKRSWFEIVNEAPADMEPVRFWDLAATEPKKGADPDYTAGAKVGRKDGTYYILDMQRDRLSPGGVESLIKQTAILDSMDITIGMEQEPGASGKAVAAQYRDSTLVGYAFYAIPSTGSKEIRANPVSSAAEAGNIKLVNGTWITDFLDEVVTFPGGSHDDQVDAVSGAFELLNREVSIEEVYVL